MQNKKVFDLSKATKATAHAAVASDTLREFWKNCTYRTGEIYIETTDKLIFQIGEAKKPTLGEYDYAYAIEETGIFAVAKDEKSLIRAFVSIAEEIQMPDENVLQLTCKTVHQTPSIKRCMAHFCIFPETELYELERFVRFCGACKYTHVVLEFWGMLQYDCLKELSWNHAYTKEEIRPIIQIANEFGIEIIPMFNHWGHAAASRAMHGKHVVLDQNPALQYHFTNGGWCWNIAKEKTRALLKNIRTELIALCGKGEFFHIGCDEAYGFDFSEKSMSDFCNFIHETTEDLVSLGRRPIAWGDMFVTPRNTFNPKNDYYAFSENLDTERYFLERVDKRVVIADWQYKAFEYPVETSFIFKNAGFDVLVCSWNTNVKNVYACANTAKDGLFGVMHTTWHTLSDGYPHVRALACECWNIPLLNMHVEAAALLRKAYFANGDEQKAGWSKKEISDITT